MLSSQVAGGLYHGALLDLKSHGQLHDPVTAQSSPSFGKGTVELINYMMTLSNPRARIILAEKRPLNLAFCIGNFFYQMMGSDAVEPVLYYNPLAKKFSDDGIVLHGTYGPRIKKQLVGVIEMLKADPMTRRAVVTIFDGRIDQVESKDIPCPVSMQFFLRGNKLHCTTVFRSQNVLMVYPYDIFLFTMLHELVVCAVRGHVKGIELGEYVQLSGSHHIYENETEMADAVTGGQIGTYTMPPMTLLTSEQWWSITWYETQLRRWGLGTGVKPSMPDSGSLYWQGIMHWLERFAIGKRAGTDALRDPSVLEELWTS